MSEDVFKIVETKSEPVLMISPQSYFTLNWGGGTIVMKDIEDAKTVALILFRGIFEHTSAPEKK